MLVHAAVFDMFKIVFSLENWQVLFLTTIYKPRRVLTMASRVSMRLKGAEQRDYVL